MFVCNIIQKINKIKVAKSLETLNSNCITQVVNLSALTVENYFEGLPNFSYLSFKMVDGRDDDISWFFCDVVKFIEMGRQTGRKTLLHCEKGISRSCSLAIAYIMWKKCNFYFYF